MAGVTGGTGAPSSIDAHEGPDGADPEADAPVEGQEDGQDEVADGASDEATEGAAQVDDASLAEDAEDDDADDADDTGPTGLVANVRRWVRDHPLLVAFLIAAVIGIAQAIWLWGHRRVGAYDPDEAGYIASSLRYRRLLFSDPLALP